MGKDGRATRVGTERPVRKPIQLVRKDLMARARVMGMEGSGQIQDMLEG